MKKTRLLEIIREEIAGALNEIGQSREEMNATKLSIEAAKAKIAAAQKELSNLQRPGVSEAELEEDQNNILVPSNLIRSYITELIYSAEDMEYTPEMIKKLKDLKGGLSGGKISIEDALNVIQQTIDITEDEIDAIEALGQAVDYDDNIINAARDIKGLNEDLLNEMAWNIVIANPKEKERIQAKIKDSTKKGEQKLSKALEILDDRTSKGLKTRIRDISDEMGVRQQEINPLIGALVDVGVLEKGESVTGVTKKKVTDKPQGRPSNPNKPEKPESTGKKGRPAGSGEKKAVRTPGADGFDDVSYSDVEDEDKEATQNIGSDSTAKELGTLATGKEDTFNRILGLVTKYKDDKAKVDAFISKAENEYKLPVSLLKQLKLAAGRDVEI